MRRRRTGFTLIELLVVIAIISLLISILLPSLSAARSRAKASMCRSNLKRLGTGMALYLDGSRDQLPPFRLKQARPTDTTDYVNAYGRKKPRWQWFVDRDEVGPVIDPELFANEIKSDGSFGDGSLGEGGESGRTMTNKYFLCPSMDGQYEFDIRNGAYGYNYQYLGNSRQDTDEDQWDNFPVNISRIRSGGRTVLLADSRGAARGHGKHSYSLDPPRLAIEKRAKKFGPGSGDVGAGQEASLYQFSPVEMRHQKRGHVVFIDTHAEAMTLQDLGYEVNEDGIPVPVLDVEGETPIATNKLWNGEAYDSLASKLGR